MSTRSGCRVLPGMYQRRTAVWEGRGANARPWEVKWSSGVAAVFILQQKCFQIYWICVCCLFAVRIYILRSIIYSEYILRSTYTPEYIVCSAGYAELPVVLLYLLQCLVYHLSLIHI